MKSQQNATLIIEQTLSIATKQITQVHPVSIDSKLLEILRCPLTKQSLSPLAKERIDEINSKISMREVHYEDGTVVEDSIEEGLITENGNRIYRVESGIPIMLYKQSIPVT